MPPTTHGRYPLSHLYKEYSEYNIQSVPSATGKTVMMFGCKNYPFHTGSNKSLHPLFAIQLRRIKCFRIRITISPLTVIKSIQTEMHKSVCFHLLPFHLLGFGYRKNRFGSFYNRLTSTKQAQGCTNTKKISVFFIKL